MYNEQFTKTIVNNSEQTSTEINGFGLSALLSEPGLACRGKRQRHFQIVQRLKSITFTVIFTVQQ